MSRILALPLRAPKLTLLLLAALTAGLGFFARSVGVDGSIENLLAAGDPEHAYFAEVESLFGPEKVTIVGVFADDVFSRATLEKIDRLSREIAELDRVQQVVSLATVQSVESDDEGLHVGKLVRQLPSTPEESRLLRERTLANRLYLRQVVAPDGTAAALTVIYETGAGAEPVARALESRIRAIVAGMEGPETFAVTGMPAIKAHDASFMGQNLAILAPLVLLLIILVLAGAFLTVRGVVIPLVTVMAGLVWTAGAMALAGSPIDMGTLMLPPLLITVGVAYSMHVVSQYDGEIEPGRTPPQLTSASTQRVGIPLAITALITVITFAPLALSSMRAVRQLGAWSILGVLSVLVATLTFAPAALALWPLPRRPRVHREGRLDSGLERLGRWAITNRRLVFLGALLTCLASAWGMTRLQVRTDYLSFFSREPGRRREDALIAERLAGTQPISVMIDGDAPGAVTKVRVLAAMRELQLFLAQQPGVDTTVSVVDYLGLLRHALTAEDPDSLPQTQGEVDQLFLFANPEDLKPLMNADRSRAHMLLRTSLSSSRDVNDFVHRLQEFSAAHFPPGIAVHPTGSVLLVNRTADALVAKEIAGLWQGVAALFAVLSVMTLSLRIGLVCVLPILVPIAVLFGVIGASGIGLNPSTGMIAALVIALGIDDTIHFLATFNREVQRRGDQAKAALHAMRSVGRPMVFTAAVLGADFLAVCLSNSPALRQLGYLSSIGIGIGLIVALLLSPALLTWGRIVTLWDLLGLDLGPEPHRQIPLFTGLRPFEARIVVVMARRASAAQGELIVRRGEATDELCVLLNGRAVLYQSSGGPPLGTMERGDVIGEMALIRKRPSSADAVVTEEADYLVLDGAFLARLERRFPRIAAVVFLNLARILSDRLETTTEALGDAHGESDHPTSG